MDKYILCKTMDVIKYTCPNHSEPMLANETHGIYIKVSICYMRNIISQGCNKLLRPAAAVILHLFPFLLSNLWSKKHNNPSVPLIMHDAYLYILYIKANMEKIFIGYGESVGSLTLVAENCIILNEIGPRGALWGNRTFIASSMWQQGEN